jgi:hypothetical protein
MVKNKINIAIFVDPEHVISLPVDSVSVNPTGIVAPQSSNAPHWIGSLPPSMLCNPVMLRYCLHVSKNLLILKNLNRIKGDGDYEKE